MKAFFWWERDVIVWTLEEFDLIVHEDANVGDAIVPTKPFVQGILAFGTGAIQMR